ncbi:MAG: (2Fe-2S)-binding protein [Proteobacteria bacterium]|nr:(2Fe-2S)-binding protein [Pseudomonadota bacterium]
MFKKQHNSTNNQIKIWFEDKEIPAYTGDSVAATLLAAGVPYTRENAVSGEKRLCYCQIGVCYECLMEINGTPNQQACMTTVQPGMRVNRQPAVRRLEE